MSEYYFLASLLPQLEIGHRPTLPFSEVKELLRVNLTKEDSEKVKRFLRLIDMENFRRVWAKEAIEARGNLSYEELLLALQEEVWPDNGEFSPYLVEFLEKNKTDEEKITHFSFLMSRFLQEESENETGFLGEFFAFEREMRLVMGGFRAKILHQNIEAELQYEETTDPIVAQLIAQKDAKSYEPPFEYKELKPLFDQYGENPKELHQALTKYRFEQIWELMGNEHFSIDRILGYLAQLILVERWLELDVQEGISIVNKIEGYVE